MPYYRSVEERFWSKVHKTRSCWIWTASLSAQGHGLFWADGRRIYAHRYAWIREYGLLLPTIVICHQCGNPACIRISHLALGSLSDNGRDGIQRPYGDGKRHTALIIQKYQHRQTVEERFWDKVDKVSSIHGCWLWKAYRDPNGYGRFRVFQGKPMHLAHRYAWSLAHGELPPLDILVCHNCPGGDNPSCVNPAHLFLGSQADNLRDTAIKQRMPSGERHHTRKLTRDDVQEIRRLRGLVSQKSLAQRFHVSQGMIANIQLCKERTLIPSEHPIQKIRRHGPYSQRVKLTIENVLDIRRQAADGILPGILAKQYNVASCTISNIVARRIWKDV